MGINFSNMIAHCLEQRRATDQNRSWQDRNCIADQCPAEFAQSVSRTDAIEAAAHQIPLSVCWLSRCHRSSKQPLE